ncbi:MAG: hypothetical protein IKX20_02685, partial [Paludibacteraceae bacterium]|nr:hypothetical protein [Paludibacteraceae bacterium]
WGVGVDGGVGCFLGWGGFVFERGRLFSRVRAWARGQNHESIKNLFSYFRSTDVALLIMSYC